MGTIHLPPDFKEFFQWFHRHNVEYHLVGGYAVGYHGYPRATMDIDVWIASTPENARRVMAALEGFGFGGSSVIKTSPMRKHHQVKRFATQSH